MTRTYQLTDDQVATIRDALERRVSLYSYFDPKMAAIMTLEGMRAKRYEAELALAALDKAGDGAATKIYVWIANEERTAALSELLGKVVRSSPEWTIGMSHIQKMIDAVEVIDVQDEQRP